MKKIVLIENIVLITGLLAVVFFALPGNIPKIALQEYTNGFAEIGREFHSFWNYTFVILYKAAFVISLFLFSRGVFNHLTQPGASYIQAISKITSSAITLVTVLVFLTFSFDATFIIGLAGKNSLENPGISILDHFVIPISSDGTIIWIIESIGALVFTSGVLISLYFLLRIYGIKPSWRPASKALPGKNKPEVSKIFLSQYFIVSLLQFSGVLPFSFPLQDAILPLFIHIVMLVNIFLFYPRFTTKSFLSIISFNAVIHFYIASAVAVLYLLLFNLTDLSLSMAYATAIPSLFITLFIVGHVISIPYYLIRKKTISANTKLVKKIERQGSELSLLKSQINPHFLFNSLNTVYGLALEEESPKTAEGVQKLSDMMRFMLQENTADKIRLAHEIKYIHNYIDFQRLRIADNSGITLDIEINGDECQGQIAPMLLIPMIENAFKHGISMNQPSWVNIQLICSDSEVTLQIQNSMHPKTKQKTEESGIGLENVRKRLEILYPEKHTFRLAQTDERFEANVKVTLS